MLQNDKVILRDFLESDIEKRIYWETEATEWQMWDAPWEYEALTEEEKERDLERYIEIMNKWVGIELPEDKKRSTFQIDINNNEHTYIGWCNSYLIDDDYKFSNTGTKCTIGIDLPEACVRNKGYGSAALKLFITYLIENGEEAIYTQTWSGNVRMIALARKLGFEECNRVLGVRLVRGAYYAALTFRLNLKKFNDLEISNGRDSR